MGLDARERLDFIRAAEKNFKVIYENTSLRVLKPQQGQVGIDVTEGDDRSGAESPWEPPEGTQLHKKLQKERLRKRRQASANSLAQTQRHQEAIGRLKRRRENGERPN